MITTTDAWRSAYPGALAGFLALRNVTNPGHHDALDERKATLEAELRAQFADQNRAALAALPAIQAYRNYYGRFKKTYHVLLQLESVAFKGRVVPRAAALVEAMFMAELKNQLLTAGHDLDSLRLPVTVGVATGSERYTLLNGKEQNLTADDMFMADGEGVISSVLYGPDSRTCITPATRSVLFAVYAPPGIARATVASHLEDIRNNVALISPDAEVALLNTLGGDA